MAYTPHAIRLEKTQLCRSHHVKAFDYQCPFAHSLAELQVSYVSQKFKTEACLASNTCRFRQNCHFLHEGEQEWPFCNRCNVNVLVSNGCITMKLRRDPNLVEFDRSDCVLAAQWGRLVPRSQMTKCLSYDVAMNFAQPHMCTSHGVLNWLYGFHVYPLLPPVPRRIPRKMAPKSVRILSV